MSERERMLDTIMQMQEWNIKKDKQIEKLELELEITENALEIACLVISKAMCPNGDWETLKKDFANAYKEQAQKELKNE